MKSDIIRIQRVGKLSSVICKGHDVYEQNRRVARVEGIGENDFFFYLFEESAKNQVLEHIRHLARCRAKTHYDPLMFFYDDDNLPNNAPQWCTDESEIQSPVY